MSSDTSLGELEPVTCEEVSQRSRWSFSTFWLIETGKKSVNWGYSRFFQHAMVADMVLLDERSHETKGMFSPRCNVILYCIAQFNYVDFSCGERHGSFYFFYLSLCGLYRLFVF